MAKAPTKAINKDAAKDTGKDTAVRIQRVATELFARQGYDGTSTKSVCEMAQANIAALHYHFGSKEALFEKILRDFAQSRHFAIARIARPVQTQGEFVILFEMLVDDILSVHEQNPELMRLIMRETELARPACLAVLGEVLGEARALICRFFARAMEQELIATVSPDLIADLIFSFFAAEFRYPEETRRALGRPLTSDQGVRSKLIMDFCRVMLGGLLHVDCVEPKR